MSALQYNFSRLKSLATITNMMESRSAFPHNAPYGSTDKVKDAFILNLKADSNVWPARFDKDLVCSKLQSLVVDKDSGAKSLAHVLYDTRFVSFFKMINY